ncbi:MAG: uL15 family ribosomal protein, partial [Planctomycetia bacterium]
LAKGIWDEVKILGNGTIAKSLKVTAHHFSASAREKILAAGGTVTEIPGPAPVAKNKRTTKAASRKKPAAG